MRVRREKSEVVALFEALGAALVWGFAFITLRWAVVAFGPMWSRALSFLLVAGAVISAALVLGHWGRAVNLQQFMLAALPGAALGISLCLQAAGIASTTVANSGFITVMYIVFIPIGEFLFFRQRLHFVHWLAVLLAVLGAAIMCGGVPTQWSSGDLLTLGCAAFGAGHFLVVQRVGKDIVSPFFFNVLQVCWAGIVTLPFAWVWEPFPTSFPTGRALAALAFLAFGSIMIGFMLQLRAQRVLSSTIAGLICLLEGPFAALFAFWILGEEMTVVQALGAATVLIAAILAALVPLPDVYRGRGSSKSNREPSPRRQLRPGSHAN